MASMNYLALCQLAHRTLRLGNQAGGTYPLVINPTPGSVDQVVFDIIDTVPRAWEKIQDESPSWNFMRKQGFKVLTTNQRTYTLTQMQSILTDYYGFIPFWGATNWPYFILYDSGANPEIDYIYPFVEYIDWRGWWDRLPRPANGQPNRLTERPDKTIELDPTPAAAPSGLPWGIRFDYRQTNQILTAGTDVPILPAEFHEMIAYLTVMMVASMRQNQGPGVAYATERYTSYMDRLKARYLPQMMVDMSYTGTM